MDCAKCGTANRDEAKFCDGCGAPLSREQQSDNNQTKPQGRYKHVWIPIVLIAICLQLAVIYHSGMVTIETVGKSLGVTLTPTPATLFGVYQRNDGRWVYPTATASSILGIPVQTWQAGLSNQSSDGWNIVIDWVNYDAAKYFHLSSPPQGAILVLATTVTNLTREPQLLEARNVYLIVEGKRYGIFSYISEPTIQWGRPGDYQTYDILWLNTMVQPGSKKVLMVFDVPPGVDLVELHIPGISKQALRPLSE